MTNQLRLGVVVGLGLAGLLTVGAPAVAYADNTAAAQALFDRGKELMAASKFDEACPKFEEAVRLVPEALGAKMFLAECYEAAGQLASAWVQFSFVESAAGRANQADRAAAAGERARALKPKLGTLTLKVPPDVKSLKGLVVTRNGVAIGAAQFGEQIPVDKGPHTVEVSAPGKKPWRGEITTSDGQPFALDVPPLEDAPVEQGTGPIGGPAGPAEPESKPTWLIPTGFVVGGVGVAALGVGGVLGGLALGKASDANDACPGGFCSAEGNALAGDASTFGNAATGLFVGGGVLAGAGILMLVLAPWDADSKEGSAEEPAKAALSFYSPAELGLGLSGKF
jgi:tetratricopeptide (TPR) repeat protein